MSAPRSFFRIHGTAVRAMLVLTVVLGLIYPAAILGAGALLPQQANGSLVRDKDGTVVGSALIGQAFTDVDGVALPQYFQSRPSASGYDAMASGGSNLGPNNEDLVTAIEERHAAGGATSDAVTASGSGLDPDISVANALAQVRTVADARGMDEASVRDLVRSKISPRDLGFLGDERVNVLDLNLSLDALEEADGR